MRLETFSLVIALNLRSGDSHPIGNASAEGSTLESGLRADLYG
jgi:hypothetical protein